MVSDYIYACQSGFTSRTILKHGNLEGNDRGKDKATPSSVNKKALDKKRKPTGEHAKGKDAVPGSKFKKKK